MHVIAEVGVADIPPPFTLPLHITCVMLQITQWTPLSGFLPRFVLCARSSCQSAPGELFPGKGHHS